MLGKSMPEDGVANREEKLCYQKLQLRIGF